jgi:hypothetical protein
MSSATGTSWLPAAPQSRLLVVLYASALGCALLFAHGAQVLLAVPVVVGLGSLLVVRRRTQVTPHSRPNRRSRRHVRAARVALDLH